jgi:hypothetical protein
MAAAVRANPILSLPALGVLQGRVQWGTRARSDRLIVAWPGGERAPCGNQEW